MPQVVYAAVVVVAVDVLWLALRLPDTALVSDLASVTVALLATVCCVAAYHRHPPALRWFWSLMAVTMFLATVVRLLRLLDRMTSGSDVSHSPVIGMICGAGLLLGTAAVLSCLTLPHSVAGRIRIVLDAVIVGLSLLPVGWVFVTSQISASTIASSARATGMLHPILDLVQLTILLAVAGSARPIWSPLGLVGISMAIHAASDIAYVVSVAHGSYRTGHPLDVSWPISYLLVVLATRLARSDDVDAADETAEVTTVPWWRVALPYLPVGGAIAAIILARDEVGSTPPLIFGSVMALLAVLALRQGLAASENSRLAARLRQLAYADPLTGLPNRLLFSRRLQHAITTRDRVAVLLLDLDGFKQVNDRCGHAVGDRLLTMAAERMRAALGSDGLLARVGGDEFAVLVYADHDAPRPEELAERLLAALRSAREEELAGPDSTTTVGMPTASIGIAEYGPQHTGEADLLRDADIAMYAAKAAGKSAYRICTPALRRAAVNRAELIADLRRAVEEGGQLELAYQPIVDVPTGQVVSAEALIRWRHPRRGLLPPSEFLPLAEEANLIVPIDRWVIEEACRAAAAWRRDSPHTAVAVNIAPWHLRRMDLTDTVEAATRAAGLPPEALTLELTETALIDGTDEVLERLHDLRGLGVRIAIDDFGTGYSSLSYLHRIPATDLKIDRSFVARVEESIQAYATVDMVTRLAVAHGLVVVAEGVETDVQHQAVTAVGCPRAQGFRYGRPGTLAELRHALRPAPTGSSSTG